MIKNDNQSMMYLLRYCDVEEEKEKLYISSSFLFRELPDFRLWFPGPGCNRKFKKG